MQLGLDAPGGPVRLGVDRTNGVESPVGGARLDDLRVDRVRDQVDEFVEFVVGQPLKGELKRVLRVAGRHEWMIAPGADGLGRQPLTRSSVRCSILLRLQRRAPERRKHRLYRWDSGRGPSMPSLATVRAR